MEREPNAIIIRCPHCGKEFAVMSKPGIAGKTVKCPKPDCQRSLKIGDNIAGYKFIEKKEDNTTLGGGKAKMGEGELVIGGTVYSLKIGSNIIGRKSAKNAANIQIDTPGQKRMSRQHIAITVAIDPVKGYVHELSLCKSECNPVYINSDELRYGDSIILHSGNIIKLPGISILFRTKKVDPDGTELDEEKMH